VNNNNRQTTAPTTSLESKLQNQRRKARYKQQLTPTKCVESTLRHADKSHQSAFHHVDSLGVICCLPAIVLCMSLWSQLSAFAAVCLLLASAYMLGRRLFYCSLLVTLEPSVGFRCCLSLACLCMLGTCRRELFIMFSSCVTLATSFVCLFAVELFFCSFHFFQPHFFVVCSPLSSSIP
jgi:hypothetical protein